MNAPQKVSDISGSALVQLALQTLARFNFKVCSNIFSIEACCSFNYALNLAMVRVMIFLSLRENQ